MPVWPRAITGRMRRRTDERGQVAGSGYGPIRTAGDDVPPRVAPTSASAGPAMTGS